MGESGRDIRLSPSAEKVVPFDIECKNTEKINIWSALEQAEKNTKPKIKELTKATIRCIPLDNPLENGTCILTGSPSIQRVVFAKSY